MTQLNLLLRRSNLLQYPGTTPGIDPSHFASKGLRKGQGYSGVMRSDGSILNLLKGSSSTFAADPWTASIQSLIGPSAFVRIVDAGTGGITESGQSTSTPTGVTIAAILIAGQTSAIVNHPIFTLSATTAVTPSFYIDRTAIHLAAYAGGSARVSSIALTLGEAYFVAYSDNNAGANFIAASLKSGKVLTNTTLSAGTGGTSDGTYIIGTDSFSNYLQSYLAAVSYTPSYLSMQQLLQWAQDPWSFWYPQRIDLAQMLQGVPAAAVTPAAGLLQTRNAPGLGPRSRHVTLLNAALPTQPIVVTVTGGTLPIMGVG